MTNIEIFIGAYCLGAITVLLISFYLYASVNKKTKSRGKNDYRA